METMTGEKQTSAAGRRVPTEVELNRSLMLCACLQCICFVCASSAHRAAARGDCGAARLRHCGARAPLRLLRTPTRACAPGTRHRDEREEEGAVGVFPGA